MPRSAVAVTIVALLVPACTPGPLFPSAPAGSQTRVAMVVSTDGADPVLHATVVAAVRDQLAHHRSIALESADARAPFPRQGYVQFEQACAELRQQGIAYVLDIDVQSGGNGGMVCTFRHPEGWRGRQVCSSYTTVPYTQSMGSFVVRTIDTATCREPRHYHRDSVVVSGPEATSRPAAQAELAAQLASFVDGELPP